MAKKNLQSLMSGIIGDTPADSAPAAHASSPSQDAPKTPDNNKPNDSLRGPGRPKKATNDDTRATFVVSAELVRKVKYISVMESCLQKDIVNDALLAYINRWEAENHKIPTPKK